ncbi:SDR family NAD(P)-dependent oxidoreductase, partial [Raoultella sp. 18098]|uniref:SDR family NAD(P)-dependent oxidoreductase n=1 Tax=Raoultella sp. 18098 TaxID=2681430 RepID=UPI00190F5CE5
DEVPVEAHRRVLEANLMGHLHGAHAVLPHFRERGAGRLINLISFGGWVAAPYAAAYTASKFGLRGLSESLRAEVSDLPHVHVCDVAPTFVDSPGLSHGANYTGRRIRPPLPMVDPNRVANAVVGLSRALRPRTVTWLGLGALPGRVVHAVAPHTLGAGCAASPTGGCRARSRCRRARATCSSRRSARPWRAGTASGAPA